MEWTAAASRREGIHTLARLVGTKQRIIHAAIRLFSEYGYENVTVRMIAGAVHLQSGSLYAHFKSKEEILTEIYKLYYEELGRVLPDTEKLLLLCETEDPFELLQKTQYHFAPEMQETMNRIVTIASMAFHVHEPSEAFLKNVLFDTIDRNLRPILERMIELGRIEPFDVEGFMILMCNYCCSAAMRDFSNMPITLEEWERGFALLIHMIRAIR